MALHDFATQQMQHLAHWATGAKALGALERLLAPSEPGFATNLGGGVWWRNLAVNVQHENCRQASIVFLTRDFLAGEWADVAAPL